jgi:hypothetical protein
LVNHGVDRPRGPEELALQGPAIDFQGHRLGKISFSYAADHSRHFACWLHQVRNQIIDQIHRLCPTSPDLTQGSMLMDAAFPSYQLSESS